MSNIPLKLATFLATMLSAALAAGADDTPADRDEYIARIYLAKLDGSGRKPLVDLPEYKRQGSPTWSHDGKRIAFDAWRPQMGETLSDAKVIVVNADGTNPRILGDGAMPSFSPRGHRIAYSRYPPAHGVWLMSSAGPEKECILLDPQGWGADWSPDGRRIVYARDDENDRANLIVYDLVEGTREPLFDAQTDRYTSFFWNFAWSPDGRRIVFKGERHDGKVEMGIVDARGAKHGLVTRFEGKVTANFAWRPDGKRILFSFPKAGPGSLMQLHAIDADTKEPPEPLPGQDAARINSAAAFSPDGTKLALVSAPPLPRKKRDK